MCPYSNIYCEVHKCVVRDGKHLKFCAVVAQYILKLNKQEKQYEERSRN